MPDNSTRAGPPSASTDFSPARNDMNINVLQAQDLRLWTRKLGVSVDSLKQAVRVVGTNAEAVQRHLQEAEACDEQRH